MIILALVFSLGFMVGQGLQEESVASPLVSDSNFSGEEFADSGQPEMTDPAAGDSSDSETQKLAANNSAGDKSMQRSYYQVLPDSETYVEVEATPVKPAEPEPVVTDQSQTTETAQAKAAPAQPAKEETPIPPAQASVVPQPAQPSNVIPTLPNVPKDPSEDIRIGRQPRMTGNAEPIPDGTIYSVQVASSTNREDSERLVQKYGEHGFQAYVMTADLGDKGIWYRVRVGNMPTREAAELLKQEILNKAPGLANGPYVIKVE